MEVKKESIGGIRMFFSRFQSEDFESLEIYDDFAKGRKGGNGCMRKWIVRVGGIEVNVEMSGLYVALE